MNLAENLNGIYSGSKKVDESVEINNPEIPKNTSPAESLLNHYEAFDFGTNMYTANKPSFNKYQRAPNDTFEFARVIYDKAGNGFRIRSANGRFSVIMNSDEAASFIYGIMSREMNDASDAQAYLEEATLKSSGSVFEANSKILFNMLANKWDDEYQDAPGTDSKHYVTI